MWIPKRAWKRPSYKLHWYYPHSCILSTVFRHRYNSDSEPLVHKAKRYTNSELTLLTITSVSLRLVDLPNTRHITWMGIREILVNTHLLGYKESSFKTIRREVRSRTDSGPFTLRTIALLELELEQASEVWGWRWRRYRIHAVIRTP